MRLTGSVAPILGAILLACSARPGACSGGDLSVRLMTPAEVGAWEPFGVRIVLENKSDGAVLPISVRLLSEQGPIGTWAIDDSFVRLASRTNGLNLRWASRNNARKTPTGWDVLWEPTAGGQQSASSANELDFATTVPLLHVEPLAPGRSDELGISLKGDYALGRQLRVETTYVILDPRRLPICRLAEYPVGIGFVACRPVDSLQGALSNLYLPFASIENHFSRIEVSSPLHIRHPKFDVGDARKLARIPAGPFGYDLRGRRWILVDESGRQTILVGSSGATETLPGDWLDPLVASNVVDGSSVFWCVRSPEEGSRLLSELGKLGIRADWMGFKGSLERGRLFFDFRRSDLPKLSKLVSELGARMISSQGTTCLGWESG
jgi:hypothetical protein